MNRFEALHTLGLEEDASQDDVRLAYYGLQKAVSSFDFSDSERIAHMVDGLLEHAKEARTFLLSTRNQSVARKVRSYASKQRGKLSVTPVEEKTARLHGLDQLRDLLVSYLYNERSKRRGSIVALIVCVVVGFVTIRYLRAAPRVVACAILGAVAIAGSTVLTASHLQVRKTRAHIVALDEQVDALRVELGLPPLAQKDAPPDAAAPEAAPGGQTLPEVAPGGQTLPAAPDAAPGETPARSPEAAAPAASLLADATYELPDCEPPSAPTCAPPSSAPTPANPSPNGCTTEGKRS